MSAMIRPYRLGHDTQQACLLEAAAFTEDYRRMGEDPRLEARRERRMERLLLWLARVFPALKFARKGYVVEHDRGIASIALFSRDGLKGHRWSIDAVGTHPDYQGKRLASTLLKHVLAEIHDHEGTTVTLKVRQDNTIAYRMYERLGFAHFHTSRQMRRVFHNEQPAEAATSIDGLAVVDRGTWHGLWRERMELHARALSPKVQLFKPMAACDFRKSWFIRLIGPWAMKLSGFQIDQWIVRQAGLLVATLRINTDLTHNRSHEIQLTVDPAVRAQLAQPLIQLACAQLAGLRAKGTLIEIDGAQTEVAAALQDAGFEEMSVWHWLGMPLDLEWPRPALDNVTV